jgi:hypothetical protein
MRRMDFKRVQVEIQLNQGYIPCSVLPSVERECSNQQTKGKVSTERQRFLICDLITKVHCSIAVI